MKQKHNRKRRGLLWISIGLLLIAAAIFLASYNLYDEQRAAKTAGEALDRLEEAMPVEASAKPAPDAPAVAEANPTLLPRDEQIELPDYILFTHMEMPVESIDGNDFIGVLQIPALDLELPVISEWSYPNLRIAPCRFSGSAYLDDMVICGHNYSAHFGKLKKLRESDVAIFTDVDGNVFSYKLVVQEILQPTDIEEMEHGDWGLTLFTCTAGGKCRIAFRFVREEDRFH